MSRALKLKAFDSLVSRGKTNSLESFSFPPRKLVLWVEISI